MQEEKQETFTNIIVKISVMLSLLITIISGIWFLASIDKAQAVNDANDVQLQKHIDNLESRIQDLENQNDELLTALLGVTPYSKRANNQ